MRRHLRAIVMLSLVTSACGGSGVPHSLTAVTSDWDTDFSTASIDLNELVVGVAAKDPRDVIPPIDDPVFQTTAEAAVWLDDDEPGVALRIGEESRFYPLRILNRHEVVNDRLEAVSVLVTYCPLCNSAIVFDRTVDGEQMRFGTSGLLRHSDLVLWDRSTQSLWQQITGEAIVGELTGSRLEPLPSAIVGWSTFAEEYPGGLVLGRNQGRKVLYGDNPYVGYSGRSAPPERYFSAEIDPRLPALERVVGISHNDEHVAVPFASAREQGAIDLEVGGESVVVLWGAGSTTDALDGFTVAAGDAIGIALAYSSEVDGRALSFRRIGDDRFVDFQTRSQWTLSGKAIGGPLTGERLELVVHTNEFWFAWQAFHDADGLKSD